MPLWVTSPVTETPEIMLVRWQLIRDSNGLVHAVGWNVTEQEGRVSSAIERCDGDQRRLITQSGRVYQLQGPSGYDGDALYVWKSWCALFDVESWSIVTHEYIPPNADEKRRLLDAARQYLADARNTTMSLHGRYSSACNALVCCHLAGLATASDRKVANDFERQRYDIEHWPAQAELDQVTARLVAILDEGKPEA